MGIFQYVASLAIIAALPVNPSTRRDESYADRKIATDHGAVKALGALLSRKNAAATLYISLDRCGTYPPVLDRLTAAGGAESIPGSIQKIFSEFGSVQVHEESANLFFISVGTSDRDLLDLRISDLEFSSAQRYNPRIALGSVIGSPEVGRFMKDGGVKSPIYIVEQILTPADSRYPHLPPHIYHQTVGYAISEIARTFKGIAIIYECRDLKEIGMDFIYS